MNQDEKLRLLAQHNKATLALTAAIQELLHGAGTLSGSHYDLQRHATEKARAEYEASRIALQNLIEEHECEGSILCQPRPPDTK